MWHEHEDENEHERKHEQAHKRKHETRHGPGELRAAATRAGAADVGNRREGRILCRLRVPGRGASGRSLSSHAQRCLPMIYVLIVLMFAVAGFGVYSYSARLQAWGLPLAAVTGVLGLVLLLLKLNVYLIIAVLVVLLAVAYRRKKDEAATWAKPVASVAGGLIILVCAVHTVRQMAGCADQALVRQTTSAPRKHDPRMVYLGESLVPLVKERKVLVLRRTGDPLAEMQWEAVQAGLGAAAGSLVEEVVGPALDAPQAEGAEPWQFSAKELDRCADAHRDCTTILLLLPLPRDYEKLALAQRPPLERPRLILLAGSTRLVTPALLDSGLVAAVLLTRPKPTEVAGPDEPQPGQPQPQVKPADAFSERYVLLTQDNLDQTVKDFPELFED